MVLAGAASVFAFACRCEPPIEPEGDEDGGISDAGVDAGIPFGFRACGAVGFDDGGVGHLIGRDAGCGDAGPVAFTVLAAGERSSFPRGFPQCLGTSVGCAEITATRLEDRAAFEAYLAGTNEADAGASIDFTANAAVAVESCACPSTGHRIVLRRAEGDACATFLSIDFDTPGNCGGGGVVTQAFSIVLVPKSSGPFMCGTGVANAAVCAP